MHILITGLPGVGKTTVIKKLCNRLSQKYTVVGFYTEEIRDNQTYERVGFRLVDISDEQSIVFLKFKQ